MKLRDSRRREQAVARSRPIRRTLIRTDHEQPTLGSAGCPVTKDRRALQLQEWTGVPRNWTGLRRWSRLSMPRWERGGENHGAREVPLTNFYLIPLSREIVQPRFDI
jgi:hypothetical protein